MDFHTIGGRVVLDSITFGQLEIVGAYCPRDLSEHPLIDEFTRIALLTSLIAKYQLDWYRGHLATEDRFNTEVPCRSLFNFTTLSSCGNRVGSDPNICPRCKSKVAVARAIGRRSKAGLLHPEDINSYNEILVAVTDF